MGMILDDKLTMDKYLNTIWKKTNSKLGILAKTCRSIYEKTAIRIYKCVIRLKLGYISFTVDFGSADRILQAALHLGPSWAKLGLTGAHMGMLLGTKA